MNARRTLATALVFAAGLLLALPASAAVDAFIWFDEPSLKGASTDANHKGWHEVSSFQFEQVRSAATTIGSATGGAGSGRAREGKVSVHDISVTKHTDSSSPKLMLFCANGKHIPSATLSMRKAGGTQQEYLVIKLKDVLVSRYQAGGAGHGGEVGTETFTLNAMDATVEYTPTPSSRAPVKVAPGAAPAALVAHTPTPTPKAVR